MDGHALRDANVVRRWPQPVTHAAYEVLLDERRDHGCRRRAPAPNFLCWQNHRVSLRSQPTSAARSTLSASNSTPPTSRNRSASIIAAASAHGEPAACVTDS